MATTTYSSIQGTLTTQLRSPKSPRKQGNYRNAAENARCLDCWNPNPKMHPCLFCKKCLATVLQKGTSQSGFYTTRNQTTGPLSSSNSFDSQDSDVTAWEKVRSKSARVSGSSNEHDESHGNRLRTPRTQEIIINSSLGVGESGHSQGAIEERPYSATKTKRPDDRASKESYVEKAQRRRSRILQKKASDFERTATKCGLCPMNVGRKTLVVYCVHCRKHLCQEHFDFHCRLTVFRPHATVNITEGTNQGLM